MSISKRKCNVFVTKVIAIASAVAMSASVAAVIPKTQAQAATSNSTLVWSDEFNGNSIDSSKWTCETGTGSWGWGNNEQQYYTDRSKNVSVHDGALHITALKESYNGSAYTSARLKTENKFYFKYGHVEARIALPSGSGIWPAFWALGQDVGTVGWPKCGEIDILEAINDENKVYGTTHWDNNGHANYGNSSSAFDITKYHIYTLDWDDQYIRMFVDGKKYHEIYIGGNSGGTDELHKSQFLLLNVAVGGEWPGYNIDNSKFPHTMKVDYIRVYQDKKNYTATSKNPVDSGTTSSSVQTYEAEKATVAGGAEIMTKQVASGDKIVGNIGGDGKTNGKVTFRVTAPDAGTYNLKIYYLLKGNRNFYVTVNNGENVKAECSGTNWNAVKSKTIQVYLNKGSNTIRLDNGAVDEWAPNLDKIELTKAAAASYVYEAEKATVAGGAEVVTKDIASGDKIVGNIGGDGKTNGKVTFRVNVSAGGTYYLDIYYLLKGNRNFYCTVNGGSSVKVACSGDNWNKVVKKTIEVKLNNGSNTIRLDNGAVDEWAPNLDKIELRKK